MTDNHHLHVEVQGDDIIVTMPDTSFRVVYGKPGRDHLQLVLKLDCLRHEQKGPITRAEFHSRAWTLAHDKARQLGWIA
jgi:hypothetical protein